MLFTVRPRSAKAFGADERSQSATYDLDVGQNPLPEFDLRFQSGLGSERGRRNQETTHISLKSTQRGLNKIHFNLHATQQKYINSTQPLDLPYFSPRQNVRRAKKL
jgi:hypothetical protein